MMEHFNQLSPAEAERLALLLEEMGEAQQAIGKILRHGYESRNPDDISHGSNRLDLEKELGHVRAAIFIMCFENDLSDTGIDLCKKTKLKRVRKYLHHQEDA